MLKNAAKADLFWLGRRSVDHLRPSPYNAGDRASASPARTSCYIPDGKPPACPHCTAIVVAILSSRACGYPLLGVGCSAADWIITAVCFQPTPRQQRLAVGCAHQFLNKSTPQPTPRLSRVAGTVAFSRFNSPCSLLPSTVGTSTSLICMSNRPEYPPRRRARRKPPIRGCTR